MTQVLLSSFVPSLIVMNMVSLPLPEPPMPAAKPGFQLEIPQSLPFKSKSAEFEKSTREMLETFRAVNHVMRSA